MRYSAPAALYRIAYEQSLRALDDQVDELSGIRARAVQYTAFVGAATGFLIGVGLSAPDRNTGFYILAGSASFVMLVGLAALALLLVSRSLYQRTDISRDDSSVRQAKRRVRFLARNSWQSQMSASILIDQWIEKDVPGPDEAALLGEVARRYDRAAERNDGTLEKARRQYTVVVMAEGVALVAWAAMVWIFA